MYFRAEKQILLLGNVDKSVTAAGDVQRGSGVDNGCVAQVGVAILVNHKLGLCAQRCHCGHCGRHGEFLKSLMSNYLNC